jgi:5-methylcytosine-specific restriction endonuclease McrA
LEAGVVVDHIIGIRDDIGGAKHDPDNLATMCSECHNYKSGKEAHNPYLVAWEYSPTGKVCKDKNKLFELLSERI